MILAASDFDLNSIITVLVFVIIAAVRAFSEFKSKKNEPPTTEHEGYDDVDEFDFEEYEAELQRQREAAGLPPQQPATPPPIG